MRRAEYRSRPRRSATSRDCGQPCCFGRSELGTCHCESHPSWLHEPCSGRPITHIRVTGPPELIERPVYVFLVLHVIVADDRRERRPCDAGVAFGSVRRKDGSPAMSSCMAEDGSATVIVAIAGAPRSRHSSSVVLWNARCHTCGTWIACTAAASRARLVSRCHRTLPAVSPLSVKTSELRPARSRQASTTRGFRSQAKATRLTGKFRRCKQS
jgi:hypothetical protein